MGWRTVVARLVYGRRARRAIAEARADLAAVDLGTSVARRTAVPLAPRQRPVRLRVLASAIRAELARQGETGPCLPCALALLGEARLMGFAPALVIGIRRGGSKMESHAWLERDGRVFLEDPTTPDRYERIAVLATEDR